MERYYLATLKLIKGCGDRRILQLLKHFCTAKQIWEAESEQLRQSRLLTESSIQSFRQLKETNVAERLQEVCKKQQIRIISCFDEGYPENLKQLCDYPVVLYLKGQGQLITPQTRNLAIVGPRLASAYGKAVVDFFLKEFTKLEYPLQIISGGARGIDTQAHKCALKYDLTTIAVFGCGLDQSYPSENKQLFEKIQEQGLIVSEYPPGAKPSKFSFPARNRIISGLSQGLILAEAPAKSGSLITAELALENGREVYCVPGSIFSENTVGVHNLIKQGAKLITNIEDILEDFTENLRVGKNRQSIFSDSDQYQQISLEATRASLELPEAQQIVYNNLDYQLELSVEELLSKTNISLGEMNLLLLQLEIQGLVLRNEYNKKYLKK